MASIRMAINPAAHPKHETTSVLKFMEDNFGFGPLAAADARANDPAADIRQNMATAASLQEHPGR